MLFDSVNERILRLHVEIPHENGGIFDFFHLAFEQIGCAFALGIGKTKVAYECDDGFSVYIQFRL